MQTPILIINLKNYIEISGNNVLLLCKAAESVAKELSVEIAVVPPIPSLGMVSSKLAIPVLSQHIDSANVGSTTGYIVPELLKSWNVVGSLVNHSERRVSFDDLNQIIVRMKKVDLTSVVCADTPKEVSQIAKFNPDFIAIEPHELIGSGIAVSKAKPEVVSESIEAAKLVNSDVKIICGAGVVDGEDVVAALKLGAEGVLVASSIVKSSDWKKKITELAKPLLNQY